MAVHYNPAAYRGFEDGSVSRSASARTARTQNQMSEARYPVLQWLAAQGYLGAEAKKTGAEIEAWRQGSAAAGVRLTEANRHLMALMSGNDPVAAALGRPAPTAEGITAAREAVTAADTVCTSFRVSRTALEVKQAWMRLWDSPDSTWVSCLDAIEGVKGPEADQARSWLTYHLIGQSELGRRGVLARTGGNWILTG